MKMFLDSAIVEEIRYALDVWDIDGLTTNPKHIKSSGKPRRKVIEEIAELFSGTDKAVSVEVNPHLTDVQQIVGEAAALSKISPNFVIKIGASESGFQAIRQLAQQGVQTNATLIFSVAQAWHAARAGANYISPFLGWKEAHGDPALDLLPDILEMLQNFGYDSQVIAAAIRNTQQIAAAAVAGAHCLTAALAVYQDSFRNPYTTMGEQLFSQAWDETPEA